MRLIPTLLFYSVVWIVLSKTRYLPRELAHLGLFGSPWFLLCLVDYALRAQRRTLPMRESPHYLEGTMTKLLGQTAQVTKITCTQLAQASTMLMQQGAQQTYIVPVGSECTRELLRLDTCTGQSSVSICEPYATTREILTYAECVRRYPQVPASSASCVDVLASELIAEPWAHREGGVLYLAKDTSTLLQRPSCVHKWAMTSAMLGLWYIGIFILCNL